MTRPTASLLAALSLACAAAAAPAAENVDHPAYLSWAKHPVGTTIVMRSETASKTRTLTTTTTSTLTGLKPDKAIIEVAKVSDATDGLIKSPVETREQFRIFPLFGKTKKEDIGKPVGAIAQGEETLTLAGREFKAVWFDTKGKGEGGLEWTTRTWMSDEVPDRLLKSVTNMPGAGTTVTVQLMEFDVPAAKK